MKKSNLIVASTIVACAGIALVIARRQSNARLDAANALVADVEARIAGLAAENARLSNSTAKPHVTLGPIANPSAELARLRAKIDDLRRQSNELSSVTGERAKKRRLAGEDIYALGDFNITEHNKILQASISGGPREKDGKVNDGRAWGSALTRYAKTHQGQFPASLDQASSYLPAPVEANADTWKLAPLSGTNNFDLVYQGSLNDLTNIPARCIALLREQQAWQTSDGNWAKTYVFADGTVEVDESDDNFQSWDAQFVVPPK